MNIVFLAAGKGSRFNKQFENKFLIKIDKKKTISDILLENLNKTKINKTIVVIGHNKKNIKEKLSNKNITFVYNKYFKKKDMLHSLIMGLKSSNSNTIISYTDIIYSENLIKRIIKNRSNYITIPVNNNWKKIWKIRKKLETSDAESLIYDKNFKLKEIGERLNKKTKSQFMGLVYIPKEKINTVIKFYKKIKNKKMQTTGFLNFILKKKIIIKVLPNNEKWYEFDDYNDLINYKNNVN
jgi:choline kinase